MSFDARRSEHFRGTKHGSTVFSASSLVLAAALCAFLSACGGSPTTPSPAGYEGRWSGLTADGSTITFNVSLEQKVTAITLGYTFNGCSGVKTYSNLNLTIQPYPSNPAEFPGPVFLHAALEPPTVTQVFGFFTSNTAAQGYVTFTEYAGCGDAVGIWTATKH